MKSVLSFDLGASSGRAIIVNMQDYNFTLDEIHRFPNNILQCEEQIFWDFENILHEIKIGIKKALEKNPNIDSIGIDTWGCDYGWLDRDGNLLRNPRSYRTNISQEIIDEVHNKINLERLYEINGNAYFNFNSIYQIYSDINREKIFQNGGKEILFMPNLILYFLTGEKSWEYTIASTSGLLNAKERNWSQEIFEKLEIPFEIKGEISYPGEKSFYLKKEIQEELQLDKPIKVSLIAGHDSACAVIGAPLKNKSSYLINGTWSLLGIESEEPFTDKIGIKSGIVNEGSIDKKIRFMAMIIGTWLLQKLKQEWNETGDNIGYKDFDMLVRQSNLDGEIEIDSEFIFPASMEKLICEKYEKKYKKSISKKQDILKIVYNSLGNQYKQAKDLIETLTDNKLEELVMVGGGVQDKYLIETVKRYINLPIVLGPVESSVIGNAIVQFIALKEIENIDEIRKNINEKSIRR